MPPLAAFSTSTTYIQLDPKILCKSQSQNRWTNGIRDRLTILILLLVGLHSTQTKLATLNGLWCSCSQWSHERISLAGARAIPELNIHGHLVEQRKDCLFFSHGSVGHNALVVLNWSRVPASSVLLTIRTRSFTELTKTKRSGHQRHRVLNETCGLFFFSNTYKDDFYGSQFYN